MCKRVFGEACDLDYFGRVVVTGFLRTHGPSRLCNERCGCACVRERETSRNAVILFHLHAYIHAS